MPIKKLTIRNIETLTTPEKPVIYYDEELKGFGLAIRPSGARSWVIEYRPGAGGRGVAKKRMVIGDPAVLTPEQARKVAKGLLGRVQRGEDPAAERTEVRAARTVGELCDEWLARHVAPKRKASTLAYYRMLSDTHIRPTLGTRKAMTITRADVARLHEDIARKVEGPGKPGARRTVRVKTRGGPVVANRVVAIFKAMWSWGETAGLLPEGTSNPAARIEMNRELAKERFLSAEETVRLGEALGLAEGGGIPWAGADESTLRSKHLPRAENRMTRFDVHSVGALRLILLTGMRVGEVLNLEWSHVDWDRGLLRLPDSKTGRKTVALSGPALMVLDGLPRQGRYVIASTSAGTKDEKPRRDLKRLWTAVTRHAELQGVRIHDLRHSFGAGGAGAGFSLHQIGGLLGHSQPSTTKRYAHLANDPQRRVADAIARPIAQALGLSGQVIDLKKRRRG